MSRIARPTAAALLTLVLLTFAAFSPVADAGFVNYDDPHYVTDNQHVLGGLSQEGIAYAFTTFDAANWHPLTWLSHMLDVTLFGVRPGWHHLVNVGLHATSAALLFFVLKGMTGAGLPSFLTAALFAVHPLRVESVAWISERKDVLSGLFWMLALLLHLRHARRPGPQSYLPVVAAFALGLLAKPMLVTLPFVLLLLDWWPLGRLRAASAPTPASPGSVAGMLLLEKAPLFALAAASCGITYVAQQRGGAMALTELFPLWARADNAVVSYLRYLGMLIWPAKLIPFYPHPGTSLPLPVVLLSLAALAGVTAFVLGRRCGRPWLALGWLWYLGTLVPVIGIVQVGRQAMADRYTYLPLIGPVLALAWEVWTRTRGRRRATAALACAFAAVLAALTVITTRQSALWHDTVTLFTHVTRTDPRNFVAFNMLGYHHLVRDELAEAAALFRKALEINPLALEARYNLGLTLAQAGETDAAIEQFDVITSFRMGAARDAEALFNLGRLLLQKGQAGEALQRLDAALTADAGQPLIHVARGLALAELGRLDDAVASFRRAAALDPQDAAARFHLGRALDTLGSDREAETEYRAALALDPRSPEVHNNFGVLLAEQGRREEAAAHFREALRLAPDYAEARFNLRKAGAGR